MTATERVAGFVTSRPTRVGIVRVWAGSLAAVSMRRRPSSKLRHSAGVRQLVLPLVVLEVVMAFLLSTMLPPAVRPAHAAFETLLVLAALGLVAAILRHPHEVDAERVILRTGFLGDVTLPRSAVRSASSVIRTVPGRGPRSVPGEPRAVACSVGSSLNAALHLNPPVRLDLGAAGTVHAATVYVSVDYLPALSASLRTTSSR
ncbi:hypothetical protein [Streptomyces sp. NPDC002132]|uniref:hypothetical protein n=1 Tax=unclassified Streptomyces TaxID=2593676 RepID=UPI00331FA854